ncbi:MAG: FecR domain-containing protein [Marinoscillum sp.]
MDHLIIKYFTNDISLEEKHQLSKWLDESDLNQKVFDKYKLYWEISEQDFSIPKKEVLDMIHKRMRRAEYPLTANREKDIPNWETYLRYAAVFLLVSTIGWYVYVNNKVEVDENIPAITYSEKISQPGTKVSTVLPDGTMVKLNSGSKLITPSHFSTEKREVVLFGEAFFDVVRDESKPFVIKTADLEVEVLGTSFVVKSYANSRAPLIAVKSGKVKVSSSTKEEVTLIKDQLAYYGSDGLVKNESFDHEVVFGWLEKKLIFNEESMDEVINQLERWFGVKVQLQDGDMTKVAPYTAKFDDPTLERVLISISHIYHFEYEVNKKKVYLTRKNH